MKDVDELRVVELKAELEKRGLDKTGVKALLIRRLREALNEEGENGNYLDEFVEEDENALKKENENSFKADSVLNSGETGVRHALHSGNDKLGAKTKVTAQKACIKLNSSLKSNLNANKGVSENKSFNKNTDVSYQEDGSVKLLLEEDEKMLLDFEENDRPDADDAPNFKDKDKISGKFIRLPKKMIKCDTVVSKSKQTENENKIVKSDSMKNLNNDFTIWVSGLAQSTKAQNLKVLFSQHAKVLSAKIVSNTKTPGSKCYGLITLTSNEGVSECISKLNKTTIDGQLIQVEKFKGANNMKLSSKNVQRGSTNDNNVVKRKPFEIITLNDDNGKSKGSSVDKKVSKAPTKLVKPRPLSSLKVDKLQSLSSGKIEKSEPRLSGKTEKSPAISSVKTNKSQSTSSIKTKKPLPPKSKGTPASVRNRNNIKERREDKERHLSIRDRLGGRNEISTSRSTRMNEDFSKKKILLAGSNVAQFFAKHLDIPEKYDLDIDVAHWPHANMAGIFEKLHPLVKPHHEFIILFGLTYDSWMYVNLLADRPLPKISVKNPNFNLESVVLNMNNFVLFCKNINPNMRVILILPTVQDMHLSNVKNVSDQRKLMRLLKPQIQMCDDSRTIHRMIQSLKGPDYMWPDKIVFSMHDVLESVGHGSQGYNQDVENFLSGRSQTLGCRRSLYYGCFPTKLLILSFWSHFVPFFHNLLRENERGDVQQAAMNNLIQNQLQQVLAAQVMGTDMESPPREMHHSRSIQHLRDGRGYMQDDRYGRDSREDRWEEERLRSIERRQKEEASKLKRERELLRLEREKVEREKDKLLQLEREQQRLERERLEKEKEELRKQQMKYDGFRRGEKRRPPSPPSSREFMEERKRISNFRENFKDYGSGRRTPPSPVDNFDRGSFYDNSFGSNDYNDRRLDGNSSSMNYWGMSGNPMNNNNNNMANNQGNQWQNPGNSWNNSSSNMGIRNQSNAFPALPMFPQNNKYGSSSGRYRN